MASLNLFTNNASTTLAAGITAGATSLSVAVGAGALFPVLTGTSQFFCSLVDNSGNIEIVLVSARVGDVFTIARGQEGTTARAFVTGNTVEHRITAANALNWETKVQLSPLGYSALIPLHTTAQRESGLGFFGYNSVTNQFEGYGATGWGSIGGGATGAGGDAVFNENDQLVTTAYTIGQSAMVSGAVVSIATPAVITIANTFIVNQPVRFTTTGALPTGLTVNGQYFVSATGLSAASFQVSATASGASIATSGTQSGVHSVGKIKSASMVGPLIVASTASVAVPTGSRLVIL